MNRQYPGNDAPRIFSREPVLGGGLIRPAYLCGVEIANDRRRGENGGGLFEDFCLSVAARDMGEVEVTHLRSSGEISSLAGGEMTKLARHLRLDLEVGGLDHKAVDAAAGLDEVIHTSAIAHMSKASAGR